MRHGSRQFLKQTSKTVDADPRLRITAYAISVGAFIIIARLVYLMIFQHDFYTALAAGSQEVYATLFPNRGAVYIQDSRTKEKYPFALNRDVFTLFADTRLIAGEEEAETTAEELAAVLAYDDEKKLVVYYQLLKEDDPYEPIEKRITEEVMEQIKEKDLPGIGFVRRPERYYPEKNLGAQIIGFVGKNEEGRDIGRYGVEGYWQEQLAGSGGFFEGARSATGQWIPLAGRSSKPASDGADLVLTLDRTLQFVLCERLQAKMEEYQASSASVVVMDPRSGAIRAMCSLPDFDPNTYGKVEQITTYNNAAIFTPYEPGSIFKPVAMAAALNEELITPRSIFYDSGSRDGLCHKPIQNAGGKVYKDQTMTGILENSINTGMVYVAELLGKQRFREYVEAFGFGLKTGIHLDSEVSGTIDSLSQNKDDKFDCYAATGSFGQGLTVTPLQMVTAFSAIANGGHLMRPYIVEEVQHTDGRVERTKPKEVRQILTSRATSLLRGMLVNVVDSGQAGSAGVRGYYVAGKTGTAQIPGPGGYTEDTIHSFIGFAPVDDPAFVMLVKFEKPQRRYSASTAAPTFGNLASFILDYYHISPGR